MEGDRQINCLIQTFWYEANLAIKVPISLAAHEKAERFHHSLSSPTEETSFFCSSNTEAGTAEFSQDDERRRTSSHPRDLHHFRDAKMFPQLEIQYITVSACTARRCRFKSLL